MSKLQTSFGISVAALAMVAFVSSASAEERTCNGQIGAQTVDNLRVPQNGTCTLRGTRVKGTIKVERGATLRADGIVVIGNVQAENARNVLIEEESRIGGSVQVVQGGGATVRNSRVNGEVYYDENRAMVKVIRSRIGGNVQAFQNTGGVEIRGNTIEENLQCKENNPRPTGGNNVVFNNKEDQCARL